jgi:hypothetical protein
MKKEDLFDYNPASSTILGLYTGPVRGGRVAANVYPQNGPHPGANLFDLELTQQFQSDGRRLTTAHNEQ